MKKKKRISDQTRHNRGLGTGTGEDYRPFVRRRDFSSSGRVHEVKGKKILRNHIFFSDLEMNFFRYFEWITSVMDIREQFPLTMEETLIIADELNITHPRDEDNDYVTMTTDFVLTIIREGKESLIAITIKYTNDFSARTIEKFQIELEYWHRKGVPYYILTEKDLNPKLNRNLKLFRDFNFDSEDALCSLLIDELRHGNFSRDNKIVDILKLLAKKHKHPFGQLNAAFTQLVKSRRINFDLHYTFSNELQLNQFIIA